MINKYLLHLVSALILSLIAGLGWWQFNIWRQAEEGRFLAAKAAREAEIVGAGDLLSLQKALAATTLSRERLAAYIITKDGVTSLLAELERTGREAGVPISIAQGESDKALTLSVEGDASFGAWFKFMELIETMPYTVKVVDWSLTKNDATTGGGWHGSATLLFDSYLP